MDFDTKKEVVMRFFGQTALATVLAVLFTGNLIACDIDGKSGIVEENNLWISSDSKNVMNLSEGDFNNVIDHIEKIYAPIVSKLGGTLQVARKWDDGTVNASAQRTGNIWQVNMYGGLARHETVTKDGFALVLCHEIGHHLGGLPKKKMLWFKMWAANEGQSDYFGNIKCMRRYAAGDDNAAIVASMTVPQYVTDKCHEHFTDAEDVAVCQRTSMAGLSLGNLFKALKNLPTDLDFKTRDPNVVAKTDHNHPAPQCRLDTYFAGSLCAKSVNEDVSDTDVKKGVCNKTTNDNVLTTRPLCWYSPSEEEGGAAKKASPKNEAELQLMTIN
jgi:hypothetical protein